MREVGKAMADALWGLPDCACGDAAAACRRRMANLLPERMSSGAKAAAVRTRRGAADISVRNESIAALLTRDER